MSKLTIELVENQDALYDVSASLDSKTVFTGENYTSEAVAMSEARKMAWMEWSLR